MTDTNSYDVIVIGAGPGGYVCAIRCAQLGMRVAVAEQRETLGGTCLNVGCIPSKALLQSSEKFAEAQHGLAAHGIEATATLNLKAMMARKDGVVDKLTKGVAYLFKKNKIAHLKGRGRLAGNGAVEVAGERYAAKHIVIATGSDVMPLPGVEIDEMRIVSSTGALALGAVPKTLAVIGAGYIGLEMGSVWARLGAQVTVVEFLDRILPGMDGEIAKQVQRILKKQGLEFRLGRKVTGAKKVRGGVTLSVEPAKGGDAESLKAEVVLVAIGRRPFTDGLGLEAAGIETAARGFIPVDGRFRTAAEGVYAIGDVVPGPMLAHKAEEEGVALAELLAGQAGHVNYETVPGIVYTWPEVASVGKTEEQLKDEGIAYRAGKFPFGANSRAICTGETDGMVKILADAGTERILGAHIVGPEAGNTIHEVVNVMEFGGCAEDLARCFHAHPTYNEAVREAALDVRGAARQR
ncbi:MAG: dihydrolipoyl dehydrogenase [Rhodospirillaceae bacterium]|nr:dihydrolipoyl dehydrogenase [Rhodospirillaceae bacterium]